MQRRKNLQDKFTTFLNIYTSNGHAITHWLVEHELVRHFRQSYNSTQEDSEEFWIQYWFKKSSQDKSNMIPRKHIASYLEETTYWVAQKYSRNSSNSNFSLQDLIQVARVNMLNSEKFSKLFKEYKPERGSIEKFAQYKLGTVLSDFLNMRVSKAKYSNAALLRAVTPTFLREALINTGVQDTANHQLSQCLFAWYCFKETYKPTKLTGTQRLEWASQAQLESITDRYNQLLSKPEEGIDGGRSNRWLKLCVKTLHDTAINSETLNQLLVTCVKALRNDISPILESLNKPLGQPSHESQITLGDTLEADNFDNYEEEELQNQEWNEIKFIVVNAYEQLSQEKKKMLQLEFGLSIGQQEIAKVFGVDQTTVHRAIKPLLKAVTQWIIEKSQSPLTPTEVKDISKAISDYLEQYFQSDFSKFLTNNFPQYQEGYNTLNIFKLHYGKGDGKGKILPLNEVAKELKITESSLQAIINSVKQHLHLKLSAEVQKDLSVPLNSLKSGDRRISAFIDTWIKNAPYATFGN